MGELEPENINSCLSTWLKRSRSCQTNLISFSDEITSLVDKVNCIDIIDLGFYKALGLAPQDILIKKLALCNTNKAHFQLISELAR